MIEDAKVSALLARLRAGKYDDLDAWRARVDRFGSPEVHGVGITHRAGPYRGVAGSARGRCARRVG